jgi:putative AlgH/UPF0301 family transcriptional regulator
MTLKDGSLVLAPDERLDPGLWFVFHHGPEGTAAFDITRAHPDIAYHRFQSVLNITDTTPETEKVVLLGGPERPDDALIILHETTTATKDSHVIDTHFSFLSYNYVLLPGKPPSLTTQGHQPTTITMKPESRFLVIMGYRLWEANELEHEIKTGDRVYLPASRDIIFETSRSKRRAETLKKVN